MDSKRDNPNARVYERFRQLIGNQNWKDTLSYKDKQDLCRLSRTRCKDCRLNTTHDKLNKFIDENICRKLQKCSGMVFLEAKPKASASSSAFLTVRKTNEPVEYYVKLFFKVNYLNQLTKRHPIDPTGNKYMENERDVYVYISDKFARQDNPTMKKFFLNLVQVCEFTNIEGLKETLSIHALPGQLQQIKDQLKSSIKFNPRDYDGKIQDRDIEQLKMTAIITNDQKDVTKLEKFLRDKNVTVHQICSVIALTLQAMNYMHTELGILHNDLHFSNIMVSARYDRDPLLQQPGYFDTTFRPLLFDWDRAVALGDKQGHRGDTKLRLSHKTDNRPFKMAYRMLVGKSGSRKVVKVVNEFMNTDKKYLNEFKLSRYGLEQADILREMAEVEQYPDRFVDIFMFFIGILNLRRHLLREGSGIDKFEELWRAIFGDAIFYPLFQQLFKVLKTLKIYDQGISYILVATFRAIQVKFVNPHLVLSTQSSNLDFVDAVNIFNFTTPRPRDVYDGLRYILTAHGHPRDVYVGPRYILPAHTGNIPQGTPPRNERSKSPRAKSPVKSNIQNGRATGTRSRTRGISFGLEGNANNPIILS